MTATDQTIGEKIIYHLTKILHADGETFMISGESILNFLGINSFERIDLIVTLEKEFGVVIPDSEICRFVSVRDISTFISRAMGSQFIDEKTCA
jgi:acyl carrier protein